MVSSGESIHTLDCQPLVASLTAAKNIHARQAGDQACPRCGKSFPDPVALVAHVESAHGTSSGTHNNTTLSGYTNRMRQWLGL